MRDPTSLPPVLASLLALSLGVAPSLAQEVGTAGAVNPASTGTPPARPTRVLELGSRVIHRERIATGAGGNVQLIFLDKTTMSIGPGSEVVIDEFVYDPNAGAGRMAASMAKGVLRFVGGNTSHSGGAEIRTPSATLGIRGGVATIEVSTCGPGAGPDCGTKVISHFGTLSITTAAGTEIIRRPGFAVTIPTPGAAPSAPRRATQAEVNQTNARVSSKPGQSGGTKSRVTEAIVARADGVGPILAQVGTAVISQQVQTVARQTGGSQTLGLAVAPLDATSPTQIQQVTTDVRGQVTTQTQQTASRGATGGDPITRPLPDNTPTSPQAFALAQSGSPAFLTPFANLFSFVSPVLGFNDGLDTEQGGTRASRTLQAGLGISGEGASQRSALFVSVGETSLGTSGAPLAAGGATGTNRSSATSLPVRFNTGLVGSGSSVALDANGTPTALSLQSGSISANGTVTPETASVVSYPGARQTSYGFTDTSARIATPAGLGGNRPALDTGPNTNFGGMVGGLVTTVNNTTGAVLPTYALSSGLFDIAFDPASSRFGTNLIVATNNTDGNALQYAALAYGDQGSGSASDRGTFVDYQNFGAREARNLDDTRSFPTQVNGQSVTAHRGAFVTSNTVNAQALFPNVAFCQCEFTRWGFWSSDTSRTVNGNSLSDLVHLGTWAFGPVAEIGQVPTQGTATYDGHAIASIKSGTAEYVAAGSFQNAVNFGSRTGTATVTNLDGRTYTGAVSLAGTSNSITGALTTSSGAAATMALNGQFSRGTVGPAGEMLGTVSISGTNYLGSGIFAGATKGITP